MVATSAGCCDSEGGRRILGEAREKTPGVEARSQLLAIEGWAQQVPDYPDLMKAMDFQCKKSPSALFIVASRLWIEMIKCRVVEG